MGGLSIGPVTRQMVQGQQMIVGQGACAALAVRFERHLRLDGHALWY